MTRRPVKLRGVLDAACLARVWRGVWGIDGRYDFVQASFDDAEGGNVPRSRRIAPRRGSSTATPTGLPGWAFLHAFDQDRIGVNETPCEGYTLVNADIAYTFKLDPRAGLVPEITIGLKGENLLDDDDRNHVLFKKNEVLQPGRTIQLYGTVKLG